MEGGNGSPGRAQKVCACVKRHKCLTCIVVVATLIAGFVLGRELHLSWGSHSSSNAMSKLWHEPVEFLYLDRTRLLSYQAQMEGGEAGAEHEIRNRVEEIKGGGSAGGLEVGASSQEENKVESTLTPVASSQVWAMLKDIENKTKSGFRVHYLNLKDFPDPNPNGKKKGTKIEEGWLVHFTTRDLLNPAYIRPYEILHHGATLAALFPPGRDQAAVRRAKIQRAKAKIFAKQIGPNPRITFAATVPAAKGKRGEAVRVLMPMQYGDLTGERSMLEKGRGRFIGGKLDVIGKVIRVFDGPATCPAGESSCGTPVYTDFATRETWLGPLKQASPYLIDNVSHRCKALWSPKQASRTGPRIEGSHCFLTRLRRDTRLSAPGMVILPVAIYK
jgi:hypothetical protein